MLRPFWNRRSVRHFFNDRSGQVVILFGLMLIPIVGAAALAVDYSRGLAVRDQIQSAADAAALAAKNDPALSPAEAKEKAESYFAENAKKLYGGELKDLHVTVTKEEVEVTAKVRLDTTLGALLGESYQDIVVRSKAVASTDDLELALVLDNTGSMQADMDDLRTGAKDLVATLFDSAGSSAKMKMSVVPYVGGVNIGNDPAHMAWMDVTAESRHHGEPLEWKYIGYEPGCVYAPGGGGGTDPGPGVHGSLWEKLPAFASMVGELFGFSKAQAATAADVPSPYNFSPDCWIASPSELNNFDLFAQIPNTEWKGCVEARAEPFDVSDDPPDAGDPNTLFVPWFWPDEVDNAALAAAGYSLTMANDYLPDRLDLRDAAAPKFSDAWVGWGQANVFKYNGSNGVIDEVGPDTSGPNRSCPDPILPLTDKRGDIEAKIDGLMHWNGSGTNIAEGLVWGWRVLSPSVPFDEGADYGKATKVIVLMTDGVNNVDPNPEFDYLSEYSAYGYLQQWGTNRIAAKTYAGFRSYADERLAQTCSNAKAAGIQIYTVAFGITDAATLQLLEDCATAPPYAYTASTSSDLIAAFQKVAQKLSKLRLAK